MDSRKTKASALMADRLSSSWFFWPDWRGAYLCSGTSKSRGVRPGFCELHFFTLTSKCEKPSTFADFRPISLCNLIYKVISKIVATRLNPILNRAISSQQFGFLKDHHVTELVGITQEVLHSVKAKNSNVLVLKLDLVKAFGRVN